VKAKRQQRQSAQSEWKSTTRYGDDPIICEIWALVLSATTLDITKEGTIRGG